jgi:hypothetical protein
MAIMKKTTNAGEDAGEKGTLKPFWWEYQLWKSVWRFLKNLKIELYSTPDQIPKGIKVSIQ